MCVYVFMYVKMNMYVEAKGEPQISFLRSCPPCVFETVYFFMPRAHWPANLD